MTVETLKVQQKNWTGMYSEVTFITNDDVTEFEIYDYQFQAIQEDNVVKVFNSESSCKYPICTLHLIDDMWACSNCGIYRENEDFRILAAQMIFNLY
jgi:hypothetical protein